MFSETFFGRRNRSNVLFYSFVLQTIAVPRLIQFDQLLSSALSTGSQVCITKFDDKPDVFNSPWRLLVRYNGHLNRLLLVKRMIVIG